MVRYSSDHRKTGDRGQESFLLVARSLSLVSNSNPLLSPFSSELLAMSYELSAISYQVSPIIYQLRSTNINKRSEQLLHSTIIRQAFRVPLNANGKTSPVHF
jgi:hypothetical protein